MSPKYAQVYREGKYHLIETEFDSGGGKTACGRTFEDYKIRSVKSGIVASEMANNLCEKCRRQHELEHDSSLMKVYEMADEYEAKQSEN